MKHFSPFRGGLGAVLAAALVLCLVQPAAAFFWDKKETPSAVPDFSKNCLAGESISFTQEDFAQASAITLSTLPDPGTGTLTLGGQPLSAGSVIEASALAGLTFQCAAQPSADTATFTFTAAFSGQAGQSEPTTVTLYFLKESNQPPIARNMDLATYRNIAITGYFDAVDGEGDPLTFQLVKTPARGEVTMAEDGSARFVYTPYENKTGKDTFTYTATDSAGNTSQTATVTINISKPDTKVTYSDLSGDPAHKAAIRLAEEDIFVGACMNGQYFFQPDQPVTRAEFLSMAMAAARLAPLEDVSVTGFSDDEAIPTWAKGAVSAALKAGVIQGSRSDTGAPVFQAEEGITQGEADVMLDQLLDISDVPMEVFSPQAGEGHWAGQAAANLAASGVVRLEDTSTDALSQTLTRGQAAMLLDGALDVMAAREADGWLPW